MYDKLIKLLRETSIDFGESDHISVMMIEAANAIEELQKQLREEKVDNVNLTGWLAEEHAKLDKAEIENIKLREEFAKYRGKHRWIPVKERLPEESGSYLIVDSGHVTEAYYGKEWAGDNWTDPVEMYMTFHPTHWMPLPEPPKGGEP